MPGGRRDRAGAQPDRRAPGGARQGGDLLGRRPPGPHGVGQRGARRRGSGPPPRSSGATRPPTSSAITPFRAWPTGASGRSGSPLDMWATTPTSSWRTASSTSGRWWPISGRSATTRWCWWATRAARPSSRITRLRPATRQSPHHPGAARTSPRRGSYRPTPSPCSTPTRHGPGCVLNGLTRRSSTSISPSSGIHRSTCTTLTTAPLSRRNSSSAIGPRKGNATGASRRGPRRHGTLSSSPGHFPPGLEDLAFIVQGTTADLRFLDGAIDPSDREVGVSLWGPPALANYLPAGIGRCSTVRSWLNQWSLDHTLGDSLRWLPEVIDPVWVGVGTADPVVTPQMAQQMHDAARASSSRRAGRDQGRRRTTSRDSRST